MSAAEIDLRLLRDEIVRTLDALIEAIPSGRFPIKREMNFYWDFSSDQLFEMTKKPDVDCVGSIGDDVDFFCPSPPREDKDYPPTLYNMVHAAGIIRYLAESDSESLLYGGHDPAPSSSP